MDEVVERTALWRDPQVVGVGHRLTTRVLVSGCRRDSMAHPWHIRSSTGAFAGVRLSPVNRRFFGVSPITWCRNGPGGVDIP